MGVRKPVDIGDRHFEKQGDAEAFFKHMLWSYEIGDAVSPQDGVDLGHLLSRHIERDEKIGIGLDHFAVIRSEEGSRCFGVVRIDGSSAGFSFHRCITQNWK